jgi:radical SAM-linked protein
LVRAQVPLVFSGGFNPRPHLSIPLPRNVGTQSTAERVCVVVRFTQCPSPAWLSECIQQQLPAGCCIRDIQCRLGKVTFQPCSVRYMFLFQTPPDAVLKTHLEKCRKEAEEKRPIEILRFAAKKGTYTPLDIGSYVETMDFTPDRIEVVCRVCPSGTVRVDEMMQWLHIEPQHLREPVRRTDIKWKSN